MSLEPTRSHSPDAEERGADVRRCDRAAARRQAEELAAGRRGENFRRVLDRAGLPRQTAGRGGAISRSRLLSDGSLADFCLDPGEALNCDQIFGAASPAASSQPSPGRPQSHERASDSRDATSGQSSECAMRNRRDRSDDSQPTTPRGSARRAVSAASPVAVHATVEARAVGPDAASPPAQSDGGRSLEELCERISVLARLGIDGDGKTMLDLDLRNCAAINLRLRIVLLGAGRVALHARRPRGDEESNKDLLGLLHTLRGRGVRVTRVTVNDDYDQDFGGAR